MINNSSNAPSEFPRVDSAREFETDNALTKPFARRVTLNDLLELKDKIPGSASAKDIPTSAALTAPAASPTAPLPSTRETLESFGTTLTALDGLHEAEAGGMVKTRFSTAAGPTSILGGVAGDVQAHVTVAVNTLTLQGLNGDRLDLNRGGATTTLALTSDQHSTLGVFENINAAGIAFNQKLWVTPQSQDVMTPSLFGARGLVGGGFGNAWTFDGLGRVAASIGGAFIASNTLEPIRWDDDAPSGVNRILTKWETMRLPAIAVDAGASWLHLGAAVRLSAYKNHQNSYEVFVDAKELGHTLAHRRGMAHLVSTSLETLGIKKGPVKLPDLNKVLESRDANHLQVGESVNMVRSGNMSGGLAVSVYGVRVGLYGAYTGETDLTVSRIDENHIDVKISPKRIKTFSANLDAMIAAEAFTSKAVATGLARNFRVDLRQDAAKKAMQKLFDDGVYPGADNTPMRLGEKSLADLRQLVREDKLPDGVTTLYMQRAEHLELRWGAAMPKPFFLTGRIAGLGLEGKTWNRSEITTDGTASLLVRSMGRGKQREFWRAGTKYKHLSAGVRQFQKLTEAGQPETRFDGLEVKLVKGLTRVVGDARARLTRKVAKLLQTDIAEPTQQGSAQTYEVGMDRMFMQEDFLQLAKTQRADHLRAAYRSGVSITHLQDLAQRMAAIGRENDNESLEFALKSAAEVQDFLIKNGQRGFSAVHQMTKGTNKDVEITVESSAFDKPVKKAFALHLKYGLVKGGQLLTQGIRETEQVDKETQRSVSLLRDDPILKKFDSAGYTAKNEALGNVQREVKNFWERLKARQEFAIGKPQTA